MRDFSINVQYQATTEWQDLTAHGLLVAAYLKAKSVGLLSKLAQTIHLRMKKVRYSWSDKLNTLWASIVVGCEHTVQINDELGAHEVAAAGLFGLERFPDQSQVNRLLWAFEPDHIAQWRQAHLDVLCQNTRATARCRWLELDNHQRLLAVDWDQRALVVSGNHYELAQPGHFGRKRGKQGYQLSAAFIGGAIGEVLDEYFDPGNTPIARRIDDLLDSLDTFCARTAIAHEQILIRGDAELGTPANIAKIQARHYHYLFKGRSSARAAKLARTVGPQTVFWRVENGAERLPRWLADLGQIEHRDESESGHGQSVSSRTLLLARQEVAVPRKRPGQGSRKKQAQTRAPRPIITKLDYFLTDLTAEQLPVQATLPTYDDRSTIERYFCDEQYALGAQHVRTHHFAGAAVFQFLVATTNNVLRWLQHSTFRHTVLEQMGLGRLIRQAMHIPARIRRWGDHWVIQLPKQHHLVQQLLKNWSELQSGPTSEQRTMALADTS